MVLFLNLLGDDAINLLDAALGDHAVYTSFVRI
jgi:hypothetical protein